MSGREPARRQVLAGAAGLLAAGLLAACQGRPGPGPTTRPPTPTPAPTAPAPAPSSTPTVPLEVMTGQMLMLGFRGTTLTPDNPVVADLSERHVGGVVLFGRDLATGGERNITSPDQLATLCSDLRATADGHLLVAVDQEGGRVARLDPRHGFPDAPSAAELGAAGDPGATRAAAEQIARTLALAGIDLNFAPVVDVDVNPANPVIGALGRSFSADPEVVAEQAAAYVRGHRAVGVLTCLKHFPGHGSSRDDSHLGFVDVTDTWSDTELVPYRRLIGAGLADTVMVAHVFNAALDADLPASLSRATVTGLLREQLGFDGVVVTDDLQMRAITDGWSLRESVRLAVEAGNDILTFSDNVDVVTPDLGRRVHETLLDLVAAGDVTEERIRLSYDRIMALKARAAP